MHSGNIDNKILKTEFRISLPSISNIGKVESVFDSFFLKHKKKKDIPNLVVSFEDVEWLDISTLLFLISITYKRNKIGRNTYYLLPSNNNIKRKDILIFLHTWRFFQVLTEITNKNISDYIIDLKSFAPIVSFYKVQNNDGAFDEKYQESPLYLNLAKDYFRKFYRDDEGLKTLHFEKNFFPLISQPFKTASERFHTLVKTLNDWDKDSLIVSVLEKNINRRSGSTNDKDEQTNKAYTEISIQNKLANDIIKESMTNSIRHPKADLLVTGSFFDKAGKNFTIVIWDNGQSIVRSLKNGLKKYGTIKDKKSSETEAGLNPSYFLASGEEDSRKLDEIDFDSKLFFSDTLPKLGDPEWKFFLASFYPGVTSKPSGVIPQREGARQLEFDFGDRIGMGLTVLLDSIIKVFDGKVTVRIDHQLITIKRIETQLLNAIYRNKHKEVFVKSLRARYQKNNIDTTNLRETNFVYQVKIVSKRYNPHFCGNMLTIRIPLK